ncbi:DoxX family protein [Parachryseolinea silvisoli]|uniref:DoxX family protein n=1 Tax=Parachryseolinea silvisoli TaxID=2873601 RepID=UPI002265E15E|nr:DoxX family protein [Parachryseolinea silvisoli]MCD9017118.1 DoxX family protein [Parachryseolinea silvisoli]
MSSKVKNITGWIVSGTMALALAGSALDKIILSQHAIQMGTSFGLSPETYRIVGIIEILSAILFVIPRTAVLGLLLLSSYLGGAITTHLLHNQGILFPAILESLIWIGACLRLPELTKRIIYAGTSGTAAGL